MDPLMLSLGATRLRRCLVAFLGGTRQWAAIEKARCRLRVEVDTLDRTCLLDDVLRRFNMTRRDMSALLKADAETPRSHIELLEWIDLADRMRATQTDVSSQGEDARQSRPRTKSGFIGMSAAGVSFCIGYGLRALVHAPI